MEKISIEAFKCPRCTFVTLDQKQIEKCLAKHYKEDAAKNAVRDEAARHEAVWDAVLASKSLTAIPVNLAKAMNEQYPGCGFYVKSSVTPVVSTSSQQHFLDISFDFKTRKLTEHMTGLTNPSPYVEGRRVDCAGLLHSFKVRCTSPNSELGGWRNRFKLIIPFSAVPNILTGYEDLIEARTQTLAEIKKLQEEKKTCLGSDMNLALLIAQRQAAQLRLNDAQKDVAAYQQATALRMKELTQELDLQIKKSRQKFNDQCASRGQASLALKP